MSTTVKIILALIFGTMLTCLAVGVLGLYLFRANHLNIVDLLIDQPLKAIRVGHSIADYDLPAGFRNVFSAKLAGYEMVGYTGADGHSHIYFFQLPADLNVDLSGIESEVRASFPGSTESYLDIRVVDSRLATIAGQEVTLVISEGMNHEGEPFREISTTFQGKKGQVLVVFSCPQASWNQLEVETFLASIR